MLYAAHFACPEEAAAGKRHMIHLGAVAGSLRPNSLNIGSNVDLLRGPGIPYGHFIADGFPSEVKI